VESVDAWLPLGLRASSAILVVALAVVAMWEWRSPRRALRAPRLVRWLGNIAVGALTIAITSWVAPALVVGAAILASDRGWGLLHQVQLPWTVSLGVSILALDLVFYAQHRVIHGSAVLWRFHRVHHADTDVDATTAFRFHPGEALMSRLAPAGAVVLLGVPAEAVVLAEALAAITGIFTHGNARLPLPLDRAVSRLLVTPDMHRIHHSAAQPETDSNFGVAFSLWDRVFGTYRPEPRDGHASMTVGLVEFRDAKYQTLPWMLVLPFLAGRRRSTPRPSSPTRHGLPERAETSAATGHGSLPLG